jgi:hypothetical protein
MDIIAAVQAVKYARKWVVEGNGPMLMEFVTYRYGGHSYVTAQRHACLLDLWSRALLGCQIRVRRIVRVKKSSACGAHKTLSVVFSATLRNGASPPSKSSRCDSLVFYLAYS